MTDRVTVKVSKTVHRKLVKLQMSLFLQSGKKFSLSAIINSMLEKGARK